MTRIALRVANSTIQLLNYKRFRNAVSRVHLRLDPLHTIRSRESMELSESSDKPLPPFKKVGKRREDAFTPHGHSWPIRGHPWFTHMYF